MSILDEATRDAPPVPDNTCPAIDRVQTEIDEIVDKLKELMDSRRGPMEDLREANSQLRESGIYWHDVAKEMQERIDVLENDVSELERENLTLRNQLENVEKVA